MIGYQNPIVAVGNNGDNVTVPREILRMLHVEYAMRRGAVCQDNQRIALVRIGESGFFTRAEHVFERAVRAVVVGEGVRVRLAVWRRWIGHVANDR